MNRAVAEDEGPGCRGTPPIMSSCVTCPGLQSGLSTGANPFDLFNDRQEETGCARSPQAALDNFPSSTTFPPSLAGDPAGPL